MTQPDALTIARAAVVLAQDSDRWEPALRTALARLPQARIRRCAGKTFIASASSGGWYVIKEGMCSCTAAQFHRLCWHRAAALLIEGVDDDRSRLVRPGQNRSDQANDRPWGHR